MSNYIDRIVRKFDKMAAKLDKHAASCVKMQEETEEISCRLHLKAKSLGEEADRAVRIRNRINSLVE